MPIYGPPRCNSVPALLGNSTWREKWANTLAQIEILDNQVGYVSVDFHCTILRAFNAAYEIEVSPEREFYSNPIAYLSNVQTIEQPRSSFLFLLLFFHRSARGRKKKKKEKNEDSVQRLRKVFAMLTVKTVNFINMS